MDPNDGASSSDVQRRTKQTVQMLLRDLSTVRKLAALCWAVRFFYLYIFLYLNTVALQLGATDSRAPSYQRFIFVRSFRTRYLRTIRCYILVEPSDIVIDKSNERNNELRDC